MSLRKKPWNRVNQPVYSISSKDGKGNSNMHIITYAVAVSMQPKQFICGIYNGTKTLELVKENPHFILQILHENQFRLVDLLGKKSGHTIDKIGRLQKRNLLTQWKDFYILKECLAVIEMKATPLTFNTNIGIQKPDHQLYLCEVVDYKNCTEGNALTIDILREKNIVRI